jgi:hypothetical protein
MSYSLSVSETASFTITHARHMASKVATDLKRIQRFYGAPSDAEIAEYETEITALLKDNLLDTVTYGFKRDGLWIEPTLKYTARDLQGSIANDDDPGRIRANANISGAVFSSYLTYSEAWWHLTESEKEAFRSKLPFRRTTGSEPGVNGYLSSDLTYASGGRALERASVRSFS